MSEVPDIIDGEFAEEVVNQDEDDVVKQKAFREQILRDVEYQGATRAAFAPPEPDEMTDNYATTKFLEEVDMPAELQAFGTKFWAAISKDVKLSNLTDDNIKLLMMMFESAKQRFLMAMPEKDFTFDIYFHLEQLKMILYTRLASARGGFERRQLSSSTKNINVGQDQARGGAGGGLLKRVTGGLKR
jgi:hypothetical protein